MKIKRFVATDMRQAMRLVRDEQGPDAVILSTRRLPDGIEVIAAVDYDEALVREAAVHAVPPSRPPAPGFDAESGDDENEDVVELSPRGRAAAQPAAVPPPPPPPMPAPAPREPARAAAPLPRAGILPERGSEHSPALSSMRRELGSMREMLEAQLASLAWNDLGRRHPLRARVLRELTRMGLDSDIAQAVAADLPMDMSSDQARYLPLGLISRRIAVGGRELSELKGALAVVGPTGVGKTTTVAKLAAHAVLRHGADKVALISTDHYRIGAGAQLGHYARLLGVPVFEARDAGELRAALARLRDRHTVLVDSAGMGAHDARLAQQMEVLRAGMPGLRACLVLAANAQSQSLDQAARAYLPLQPRSCILTKLDEAPMLGGALSVLVRHGLVLDYTTDGQRVPEDIAVADARRLVCQAARVDGPGNGEDDDLCMAERFGRMASALA